MPRDLSDVLHYFMPELEPERDADAEQRAGVMEPEERVVRGARRAARAQLSVLPIVGVPVGERDVVRAAFTWNLAVEVARLGGRSVLLAPGCEDPSPLWPEAGVGPLGCELLPTAAGDIGALYRAAIDTAVSRADGAADGGLVFVRIPPAWLREPKDGGALLRWTLLFTSPNSHDLRETYGLAKLVLSANARAQVGVTIHGARKRKEAEEAFARLARATQKRLGRDLVSYGLLVDDLHVYRAIVAQRPIGLAHPQSPAARTLRDVAQMLLDDARKSSVV